MESQLRERDAVIHDLRRQLEEERAFRAAEIARLEILLRERPAPPRAPEPKPKPDDLKLIWGVGPVLERKLHAQGVYTFRDVALWTDEDIDRVEPRLETIPDRVRRENWMAHARQLHHDKYGEWLPEISRRKFEGHAELEKLEPAKSATHKTTAAADDLERISGVGPVLAGKLNSLGITSFAQVAAWTDADINRIEPQLDSVAGRIEREGWVKQAGELARDGQSSTGKGAGS